MARVFLVMDEPKNCDTCPLDCSRAMSGEDKPSPWCPLKPVPEAQGPLNGVSEAWKEGWNACINAICGLDTFKKKER